MGGTRYITQKALHGMSAQRTVSIQEAVHMVDNQRLGDMFGKIHSSQLASRCGTYQ